MLYAKMDNKAREELEQEMTQTNNLKWYRRLKIIDLSAKMYSVLTLAEMFDVCQATVRSYIKRYEAGGLSKLKADPIPGRPSKFNWTKEEWLDLIHQPPSQFEKLETGAKNWTFALLQRYLSCYENVKVSRVAICKKLKQQKISWHRARLKITSPDPLYVVKRARIKELKNKAKQGSLTSDDAQGPPAESMKANLVFFDSTDLHLCPDTGAGHCQQGKQLKVESPGKDNPWLALFGSLSYPSGEGLYTIHQRKRHQEVQTHLQLLIDQDPDAFWFVISDNASAHTTELLADFFESNQHRLQMVFLPTYSPHLNLIERLWRFMRGQVTRNQYFETLNALSLTVVNWFQKVPFSQFCSLMGIDDSSLSFV